MGLFIGELLRKFDLEGSYLEIDKKFRDIGNI